MSNKIKEVLNEAISEAKPSYEEIENIESKVRIFIEKFENELRNHKIDAEIFVGGSFAKNTLIKKEKYDVDIFARFDRKYIKENISDLTHKILKKIWRNKINVIHGSRDYFKIDIEAGLCFEIVPVIKVSNPKEAENITDLSYFHVRYANKKIKGKMSDDIILAKSFCHANRIYGAESHIKGFSGYSLELLIIYYKSFEKLIREIAKSKEDKIIIDIEKAYKNKKQILMDMNSSKLESPIILVDPTYKQRNALATLSKEVFDKFKNRCKEFLKNPNINFFRMKEINFNDIENSAKNRGYEFILLQISTNKQEGAVAGSKLLKFYNHLENTIKKYFEIKEKGFYYYNKEDADCFFAARKKGKIIINGPPGNMKEAEKFRKKHKNAIVKNGRLYAEEEIKFDLRKFIADWKNSNKKIIRDMYISDIKII